MPNLTSVGVTSGVPTSGTGTVSTLDALMADGGQATIGAKADPASTATDTTAVSSVSIWKQISKTLQAAAGAVATAFFAKITDGTNTAVIKGASTAAVATDPALVVTLSPNGVNGNGQAVMASSAPVVLASDLPAIKGYYVAVAASQTDAVIQSTTGAAGDYLDYVVVIPATTAPGVVTIKDNTTAIISYVGGGTTALLSVIPFTINVGAFSRSGAWKITTGANVSVVAVGKFS